MVTNVTIITGEGATSYTVSAGSRGPAGATGATGAAGSNTITTATTTPLVGFLSGNGATVTASTSATFDDGSQAVFANGSGAVFASGSFANFASSSVANFNRDSFASFDIGSQANFEDGSQASFASGSQASFDDGSFARFKDGTIKLVGTHTSSLNFVNPTSAKTITLPDATGTVALTNDARFTDARTPLAHTHVVSDIVSIASQRLIGRHAGGTGAGQEIQASGGVEFSGGAIQRSALTGDITASAGSNATTLATTIAGNKTFSGTMELSSTLTVGGQTQLAATQAATDANSAMTRRLADARYFLNLIRGTYRWSNTSSTYSASHVLEGTASTSTGVLDLATSATAGSVSFIRSNTFNIRPWQVVNGSARGTVDWSRRTIHNVKLQVQILTGADTIVRILLGQSLTNTTAQNFSSSDRGIGFRIVNGLISAHVANGLTVTTSSTGITAANTTEHDIAIESDGAGNWNAYVNGTLTNSGTGAPTGTSTAGNNALCLSVTNGTTAAVRQIYLVQQTTVQF